MVKIGVHLRKLSQTGVPLFWTTLYIKLNPYNLSLVVCLANNLIASCWYFGFSCGWLWLKRSDITRCRRQTAACRIFSRRISSVENSYGVRANAAWRLAREWRRSAALVYNRLHKQQVKTEPDSNTTSYGQAKTSCHVILMSNQSAAAL